MRLMIGWTSSFLALSVSALAAKAQAEDPAPLQGYLQEAITSNQALQAQHQSVLAAAAALAAARRSHYPRLSLNARYTVAEGGRELEFPVGDLLNPVYQTLNQLTANSPQPSQFPSIDNQQIALLREREQDSRLSLSAPLYAPQIGADVQIRRAQLQGREAEREVYARQLLREVKVTYYSLGQARAAVGILESSRISLLENERVAQSLIDAGKATRDRLLRAQAERLAIDSRLSAARQDERQALRYLNLLRNRELLSDAEFMEPATPPAAIGEPQARAELRALDAGIAQARGGEALVNASYRPTLALAADSGIQGEDYRFGNGAEVSTASLVLSWNLFDFGTRQARLSAAQAEVGRLEAQRADLAQQLALAHAFARDQLATRSEQTLTAEARLLAAAESFRIAERKRDAGQLSQIEFLDAERAQTEARLAQAIARYDWHRAAAELEYASASAPLPALTRPTPNPARSLP